MIDKLKKQRKTMERGTVEYSILTLLIGECETIAKRGQEVDVAKIATKLMKANQEVLDITFNQDLVLENNFLSQFLPKQLTETELTVIIKSLDTKNVGDIMKHLVANYKGEYDGKLASAIARGL